MTHETNPGAKGYPVEMRKEAAAYSFDKGVARAAREYKVDEGSIKNWRKAYFPERLDTDGRDQNGYWLKGRSGNKKGRPTTQAEARRHAQEAAEAGFAILNHIMQETLEGVQSGEGLDDDDLNNLRASLKLAAEFGLAKPKQASAIEISGPDGGAIETKRGPSIDPRKLTAEQLKTWLEIIEQAKAGQQEDGEAD